MEPLDSRTKSGKIIDEVIKGLPEGTNVIKSNLFDYAYLPDMHLRSVRALDWVSRLRPTGRDIIICLGGIVQSYLPHLRGIKRIEVPQPASRHIKKEQYIQSLISKILEHE